MRMGTTHRVALFVKLAIMGVSTAGAQEASEATELEEIIVTATGTHITGFDAPTPLTTVTAKELQTKAVQRMSDLIIDVPAFSANQNIGRSSAPIGASNFDLRGLGTTRTLLLVDGRRVAPTEPTGTIDTNIIPAGLIKNLDIVTGGASAAYGSDAVSGVVNITLNDRFEGLKSDVQYGRSTYGDVSSPAASLTGGHGFVGGRLHVVGSLDYYNNHGQLVQSSRPWGRDDYALIPNSSGTPRLLEASGVRFSQLTFGGVTASNSIAALRGIQFGPGGTVQPFNYGSNVGTTFMIGGDGAALAGDANILPELERSAAFTRATFDATDRITLYADALYADFEGYSDSTFAVNRQPIPISINNAFLPQPVRDIMVANGATSFNMGRIVGEAGKTNTSVDNTVQRYGLGARGELGDTWHWDTAVQYSRTDYDRVDGNNQNLRRYSLGVDSVINPANGQPICRSLLNAPTSTDPDIANCVPINIFGAGSISQAALDYFTGASILNSEQEQTLVGVNFDGSLFTVPAGDVSLAVGGEYRKDEIVATSDPISQATGWFAVNSKPLSGDVNVKEAYAEVVVPLLRDKPAASLLDVNGAVRLTDYSTSGSVTTWKTGFNYSPVSDVRLRATLSRDIRAPSINELFSGQTQIVNILVDPRSNTAGPVPVFTGGNPTLTPETSKAYTAGVVYTPVWAQSLRMSVDYYSFEITDAISALGLTGQQVLDGCFIQNQQTLCNAISFNPDGSLRQIAGTLINVAEAETSGIDVELGYAMPVGAAKMDFRLLGTYVDKLNTTLNGVTRDVVGQLGSESSGGIPKWRFVGSARYSRSTWGAGVLLRYIHSGVYRTDFVDGVDINDNTIPSKTYVDLDFSQRFGEGFEVYAKVNNVFNVDPPLAPSQITEPNYNSGAFHDRIGRYFKLGARFQF
jgi:iron complex outermembrane recepter protein